MKKKRLIIVVFLVLLVGVGALVYMGQHRHKDGELYYSGTIESTDSQLAFQVSGRVAVVHVKEGQGVEKGQLLAELDPAVYQAQFEQAGANLEKAGRSEAQLEANLAVLKKTLPADVIRAEAGVASAKASLDQADKDRIRYLQLFKDEIVAEKDWDAVRLRYDTEAARMQEAAAALNQAKSRLGQIDALEKEIAAARAQVKSAEATLKQAEIQVRYCRLLAPYKGTIVSRNVEPGEVMTPARQVLTLSDLSTVKLKIFVGETEIGRVKTGQAVEVRTDTFPDKRYRGAVSFISPEGEFTPKIIQTHKERVKLVYLVEVLVPNPDLELKSGMPADAWLR